MRVPANGDPARAVVRVPKVAEENRPVVECDVLVVGGGTGGVAAALAALRRGRSVCMVEETDWLGGQMTSQGVAALDEHDEIGRFGGTASYYELRRLIRTHYERLSGRRPDPTFNPGACWVGHLAFEPKVAVAAVDSLLRPFLESGTLRVLLRSKAFAASRSDIRVETVSVIALETGTVTCFRPRFVVDATELGDLLPLAGLAYRLGAESIAETGERHAQPETPRTDCVQSFTYTFALERRPAGEMHTIPAPPRYQHYRERQPYTLTIEVHAGEIYGEESGWLAYRLFERMPGTKGSLWTYRRLVDATNLSSVSPHDVSMINWPGNDYRDRSILDLPATAAATALQDAKRVSLGFLHWLQTAAPSSDDRLGAAELHLRADVMDTDDGLAKHPYIREARRIRALRTILEQDVSIEFQAGRRAEHFVDSVGVGWYPIDIHRSGPADVGLSCRTRPFQIPLGALVPLGCVNVAAGAKNIGTTHITNGCYRLHPVEWNIGEAAGALAAWSLEEGVSPEQIWRDTRLLKRFQRSLLQEGVPLAWVPDVGVDHSAFVAVQSLFMARVLHSDDLEFSPTQPLTSKDWQAWGGETEPPPTRADGAHLLLANPNGQRSL